jgi:hypothetical protein
LFEVEGVAVGAVIDLLEESEDELVFEVESEGASGDEEFADIGSSLPGIDVKGEEGVQFLNGFGGEDGVLGSDVLGEDGLELLLLGFALGHLDLLVKNKI